MMACLAWLACAAPDAPAPSSSAEAAPGAPDLVLVGIAGLRGDTPSGARQAFGAALEDGAHSTVAFSAAYAQSTSRFTSWGSILAGRYTSAIPLCGLLVSKAGAPGPWCNAFPEARKSLPEVLALYGYRTALLASDLPGLAHYRRLFQDVLEADTAGVVSDWGALAGMARDWWEADASRPRLLVVATSDMLVQERPALLAAAGLDAEGGRDGPPIDHARLFRAYAEAAGVAGAGTATLLEALPSARARWAFAFGIHGLELADSSEPWQALGSEQPWSDLLLERTLHVPLVVVGPAASPAEAASRREEARVVELLDLLPTLTRLAGAVPPVLLPGSDLLVAAEDDPGIAYAEFGDMLAVRQGDRTYTVRGFFHYRSSLDPELTNFLLDRTPNPMKHFLHDVARDPFQQRNLLHADAAGAVRMHELMLSIRRGAGAPPPDALDARRVFELRLSPSQGYW